MEKSNCLGIMKKSSQISSWEELAFAEDDAAGSLWPPRSYTCSFCRREFRSAQALGGHMNIHRRDKARVKQDEDKFFFSESHNYEKHEFSTQNQLVINEVTLECDDDICENSCFTLVFNPNPSLLKSQKNSCAINLSPLRGPSTQHSKQDPSSSALESSKNSKKILTTSSWPCSVTFGEQRPSEVYNILTMEGDKRRKMDREATKSGHQAKLNLSKTTDLSVSMNLVIHQSFPIRAYFGDENKERDEFCKIKRRHESSLKPPDSISRLSNKNKVNSRDKGLKLKGDCSEKEIDLELRLWTDPPKKTWSMDTQKST